MDVLALVVIAFGLIAVATGSAVVWGVLAVSALACGVLLI
jgi:hypothetical protein